MKHCPKCKRNWQVDGNQKCPYCDCKLKEGVYLIPGTNTFGFRHLPEIEVELQPVKNFLEALVEMTEGAADIDKKSIVRPGVTLRREAKILLERIKNKIV